MAGERLVEDDPSLGARVLIRAHKIGGDVLNAWRVLVDWGADGDEKKALGILAQEVGGEADAREILADRRIEVNV